MRWTPGKRSGQLEDRRGQRLGGAGSSAGAFMLLSFLFRRFGILGVLVGGAALYFLGGFGGGGEAGLSADEQGRTSVATSEEETLVQFVSFVLDDTQATWTRLFEAQPQPYPLAKLVLFRGATRSQCGLGQSEMGPFYCPADSKVYLDLGFFEELDRRLGAPGDFAQAYVIAHEIGHHVQNVLGTSDRVHRASARQRSGELGLSVRLELQADCYSGVWAHSARQRGILETGDLEEAIRAASKIGDDALQQQGSGTVRPETFTHGTSEQRAHWFRRGFEKGDVAACDTFAAKQL